MSTNRVEQRRSKRIPTKMNLEVSSLFKQDNVKVNNINAPIEVIDISKDGIGFLSSSMLPIGFYFNARLEFEKHDRCFELCCAYYSSGGVCRWCFQLWLRICRDGIRV